jgi:hypothetical protein
MDFAIAAVVMMLLAAIVLPSINNSRYQSRVLACQDNLRTVGMSLLEYAEMHGGQNLPIPADEKLGFAGIFAPTLIECGLVEDRGLFRCAGHSSSEKFAPVIPTVDQLRAADGPGLIRLQRTAGGDYAFSLGSLVNGQYASTLNQSRPDYVLLADAPSATLAGRASSNHGGNGQNAFFEDGHIQFLSSPVISGDSIYENDWGNIAPGAHADDCVVAPSATRILRPSTMMVD